jgi:hypothetical protein
MATLRVITRIGHLTFPHLQTRNQCKAPGHRDYRYELKVSCGWGTRLDKLGFIIDHQHLDSAVQNIELDSCERMGAQIISQVSRTLISRRVPYTQIHLRLQPILNSGEEMKAFFEIFHRRRFSWLRLFLDSL